MESKTSKRKTSKGTWIFTILVVIGLLTVLGVVVGSGQQSQQAAQSTQPTESASTTDNLKLQNECIANAQATDEANPLYYSTLQVGDQPPGWTLAGQENLQTQITGCKSQYPTN